MLQSIVIVTPMLVCVFWTLTLALDYVERGNQGCHRALLLWSAVTTLLYVGHFVFYSGERSLIPFFDTLYVGCNIAVFPLYLRYLSLLTEGRVARWLNALTIIPPLSLSISVGVLYLTLTSATRDAFITTYLYQNNYAGLDGNARLLARLHDMGKVFFAFTVLTTLWLGFVKVRRYNGLVDSIYADTDGKRLHGIMLILSLHGGDEFRFLYREYHWQTCVCRQDVAARRSFFHLLRTALRPELLRLQATVFL